MTLHLKEAGLQKLALTNRNCIRGLFKGVSKHIIVKLKVNNLNQVDATEVSGRTSALLREALEEIRFLCAKESAEAIVVDGT